MATSLAWMPSRPMTDVRFVMASAWSRLICLGSFDGSVYGWMDAIWANLVGAGRCISIAHVMGL